MPRRLAQQRMTLSDLEWPFHASRAISAVAELLVPVAAHVFVNVFYIADYAKRHIEINAAQTGNSCNPIT